MKITFKKKMFSPKEYTKLNGVTLLQTAEHYFIVEPYMDSVEVHFSREDHMREFRELLDAKYCQYCVEYI